MSQMMPPDIGAMLAGGGGGAPQGPMPPDIGALLGGGADQGASEGAPLPTDGQHGGGKDPLEQAISFLDDAIAAEADQEDQQIMRQCSAKLHQVLANNQKDADSMLQGQSSPRGIRKAAGAPGGP